jgi:ubiquinone/menaquinone biosynthesis C-methylase UbiE
MGLKKEIKNINFWKRLLKNLPKSYKSWFEDEKVFLQKIITKDSKVLEVGCGDGRSLNYIINITQNIIGIDNDDIAVKDAKINFKNYPNVKILLAEASKLPFKDKSFDFVMCMTTFANFGNEKYKILKEMKRVLKDDGKIIISVFSEDALEERMKVYKTIGAGATILEVKDNGTVIFDEKLGANISEQFSEKELIEIFNKVNFKVDEIIKSGIGYICEISKQNRLEKV